MIRLAPGALALLTATTLVAAGSTALSAQERPVLVSTDWLADQMGEPDVVLLHVGMSMRGTPETFIQGARLLDYHDFAADANDLVIEVQPVPDMVAALRAAGVSNDSRVVLYGSGSAHLPARIYMTLDFLGHGDRTSVLDGGLETWMAEGRPTSANHVAASAAGTFEPSLQDDVLVTAEWLAARLDDDEVTVLDARPETEYTGERTPEGLRPGHIPGAYNLYWADLMVSEDEPVLRALDEVKARWEEAGATPDGVVVSYCYIGMRASYTYLISKHLGYDARFYDGSWNEWGATDLPATEGRSRR